MSAEVDELTLEQRVDALKAQLVTLGVERDAQVAKLTNDLAAMARERDYHKGVAEAADRERIEHQNVASESMRQAAGARAEAAGLRSARAARL